MIFRFNRSSFIYGLAKYIHDAPQRRLADRNLDGLAGIGYLKSALQSVAGSHGDGSNDTISHLLLHFQRKTGLLYFECVIDFWNLCSWKLHVHDCSNDLDNFPLCHDCLLFTGIYFSSTTRMLV